MAELFRQQKAPRWALMVEPHNKIREVLLPQVERRLEMGWILIGRESDEMFEWCQSADED
jgi:hypothetical protein